MDRQHHRLRTTPCDPRDAASHPVDRRVAVDVDCDQRSAIVVEAGIPRRRHRYRHRHPREDPRRHVRHARYPRVARAGPVREDVTRMLRTNCYRGIQAVAKAGTKKRSVGGRSWYSVPVDQRCEPRLNSSATARSKSGICGSRSSWKWPRPPRAGRSRREALGDYDQFRSKHRRRRTPAGR